MKTIRNLLVVGIAAASFGAVAQTANTPGGQAATGTPLDQSNGTPAKSTPKSTSTTPDSTNPSGSTSRGTAPATKANDAAETTKTRGTGAKATNPTPPGDVPTYPAPAKDGTPTK